MSWSRAALLSLGALLAGNAAGEVLLVVRKSADALDLVDPGSGVALASLPVGFAPHEVAVSPNRRWAAVSNYGTDSRPGQALTLVDLEHPTRSHTIDITPYTRPHGVAWLDDQRIAVTSEASRQLLIVDAGAGAVKQSLATDRETSHMVSTDPSGGHAYVTNLGSGSLSVFDLAKGVKVADVATGAGSEGVAVSPDGREIWVTARQADEIAIVDAATLSVVQRVPMPGMPIRVVLARDGGTAYITCARAGEVVAIDTATRSVRARHRIDLPLASGAAGRPLYAKLSAGSVAPVGVASALDGKSIYVSATMADAVVQLDAVNLQVLRTIAVHGEPDGAGITDVMPRAVCHACKAP
jgi:YVTN family beta-propeller protein